MNHPNWIYSVSIAVLCAYGVVASHAAQNAPTFMSKDGQIQSVNKYSSNPFWSPNSPYNQRIPTPIYATGPDLTTGDCNTVVKTLVASHCAARNNCTDLRISDVRPNIMVQLSQLPGHSYATSCGGYIDSAFENYKKTYGNVSAVNIVYSGNNKANNTLRLTPATYTPTETETRTAELERLQKETTPGAGIDATLFPKTVDDLSFTDRLANTTVGYEPYKNLESYKTPKFETETEYYERMKPLLEHQITYVNAGVANGCPKTYMTGRGATVSCVPTRDPRSEFVSWCLDAKLTNCAQEHIISPTDRDDKVFYAKWDCISNSVKHGDKCECTDPHMNQYCECTGIYTTDPSDATRCVCVNGENPANNCGISGGGFSSSFDDGGFSGGSNDEDSNSSPNNNPNRPITARCQPTAPTNVPECLSNLTDIVSFDENETINDLVRDSRRLIVIGNAILNECLTPGLADLTLSNFNDWLYRNDTIPITIGSQTCLLDAETVFNYVNFPTSFLFSTMNNLAPGYSISTFRGAYITTDNCSDQSIGGHSDHNTTIHLAATATNLPHTCENGITYFVDYPVGRSNRVFPGLLLESCASFFGQEHLIRVLNYKKALTLAHTFADNINLPQYNKNCSSQGLNMYLVKQPITNYTRLNGYGYDSGVDKVTIVTDPFHIP